MHPPEPLDWLAAESDAFARALAGGELAAPVPTCPGWTVAQLAEHLGGVHRWATRAVLEGPTDDAVQAPAGRAALRSWFAEGAEALLRTLRSSDPDQPCWTLAAPATVAFWIRRQAHETAIHRWDAQAAHGPADPLDAAQAADGVAEVVEVMFPRQVRLRRLAPLRHSVRIEIDGGASYLLSGAGTEPDTDAGADATVSGPADALFLLLWKRTGLDDPRIRVTGQAAGEVLAAKLTP